MSYDAIIYQYGGTSELSDVSSAVTNVDWHRDLDTFGEAKVSMLSQDAPCCGDIQYVRPYLHELHLARDGQTVFDGPILIGPSGIDPTLIAEELTGWFKVRWIRDVIDYSATSTDACLVAARFIRSALEVQDPKLLRFLEVIPGAVASDRASNVLPVPHEIAWTDHLQSMVGKVVHMSTLGRMISIWPVRKALRHMGTLSDFDFVKPAPVFRDGNEFATAAVVWNGDKTTPVAASAGGVHPQWGVLVERTLVDDKTTAAAAAATATQLVDKDVPLVSSVSEGFTLDLKWDCAKIDLHKIQPGNTVDLILNQGCLPFSATVQITRVGDRYSNGVSNPYIVVREMT